MPTSVFTCFVKSLLVGALAVAPLIGCSLEDLRELKKNAKTLPVKAQEAAQKADTMIAIKREVDAVDMQLKVFTLMRLAPTDTERLALSHVFYRAFEFQKWTGETADTPALKEELYRKAFYVFLPLVNGLIPRGYPLRQRWLTRDWRLLGVLAASMDEIDPIQKSSTGEAGAVGESIYALIESAVTAADPAARAGSYVSIVRQWLPEVQYLLQVRHNYLIALAAEQLTSVEFGYREQLGFDGWDARAPKTATPERLAAVADLIDRAERTRALLISIGVPATLNQRIARRWARVRAQLPPDWRDR